MKDKMYFACLIHMYAFEDSPEENTFLTCHTMAQHLRQCSENPNNWAFSLIFL